MNMGIRFVWLECESGADGFQFEKGAKHAATFIGTVIVAVDDVTRIDGSNLIGTVQFMQRDFLASPNGLTLTLQQPAKEEEKSACLTSSTGRLAQVILTNAGKGQGNGPGVAVPDDGKGHVGGA